MHNKALSTKNLSVLSLLSSGFIMIGVGFVFLIEKPVLIFTFGWLFNLIVVFFSLSSFAHFIGFILDLRKKKIVYSKILESLLNGFTATIIGIYPNQVLSLIPLFFGVYAFSSGVIRLISYLQFKRNQVKGRLFYLFSSILLVIFSYVIFSNPLSSLFTISNVVGVFFLFYGLTFVRDAITEGLPNSTKNSFKRRIRISLPVFVVALLPHSILRKLNESLQADDSQDVLFSTKENIPYDLEVLVHVSEKGYSAFGHVDLVYKGQVYTYGAYDPKTYKLNGAIADGVLIVIHNKEDYIAFSKEHLNKTLFGFGLKLNEAQKQRIDDKLEKIHENLIPWYPQSQQAALKDNTNTLLFEDYASVVFNRLNGTFYKFKKGKFKTYFIFNTNCVLLADEIIGQSGIDALNIHGLISPGTYYDFLNREFLKQNSIVIARNVYYSMKDKENNN